MSSLQEQARALAIAQNFGPDALELNRQLVAADPADTHSRTRLARCLLEAGRLDEAEAEYREVLRADPKNRIAANGVAAIEHIRRDSVPAPERVGPVRAPRAPREARVTGAVVRRQPAENREAVDPGSVPLVFTGFDRAAFDELVRCPRSDIRDRFAPRVVDLVKRVNALGSAEEIAGVREAGRKRLFRTGRSDVHVDRAHWYVFNLGGRWEPQFNIGMYGGPRSGDWLRIGIGFNLAADGAEADREGGVDTVRTHFRRFQEILSSSPRSLFLGWMIKEGGLLQTEAGGPRSDLREAVQAADQIVTSDPSRAGWVFFGKWLTPDRPDDAAVLANPVALVRTIDRVFLGLLPLWRALWA